MKRMKRRKNKMIKISSLTQMISFRGNLMNKVEIVC